MSEKKTNLTDFFKKENKKKPAAKPKQAATDQVQAQADLNELPKEKASKKDDYESSEEEKTDLIIGEESAGLIKDKKEIQAQKRK